MFTSFAELSAYVRRLHRAAPGACRVFMPPSAEGIIVSDPPPALASDVINRGFAAIPYIDGLLVDWSDRTTETIYVA